VKTEIRRVGIDNDVDVDVDDGGGDRTMMVGETFTTQLDAVNNDRHLQPSNKDHFDDDLLPSYELADTIMRGIRDIELSLTTSEIHHQSSSIEKHGPHRYGDSNNSNKDRMYNFGMEEDEVIVPPLGKKEIRVKRSKSNNRMIGAAFIVDDNHSDDSNDDKDDDDDDHNGNDNHIPSSIKKSFIRSSRLRDRSLSSSLLLHTVRNNNNNNTQFMDFTRISFNPNSIENRAYASKRTINVTSTTTHATTTVAATNLSTTTTTSATTTTTTTTSATTTTSTSAVVTTTSTVLPTTESIASPSHVSHKQSQSITHPHSTAHTSPSSALVLSLQPLHHDAPAPTTTTTSSTTITTTTPTPTTVGERRTRHMNSIIYESSTTAKLSSRTSSKLLRGSIMSTGAQLQHLSGQHLSGQHLSGQHLSGQHLSGQHLSDRQILGSAMTGGGKESPMMQTQVTFVNNDSNYHIHYDRNSSNSSSVRKIHSPLSIDPDGNSNINTEAMIAQLRQATVYDSTRQPFPPLKLDEVVNIITNIVHPLTTTTTTIPSPQSSVQPSPVRKSPRAHKVGAIVSKGGFSSIDWSTPSNKPNCNPVLWSIGSSGQDHDPTVDQHHTHLNHHHQPHQQHGDNTASVNQNTTTTKNNTPNSKLSRHMNPQSPTQQQQQSPIIAQHNLPVDYTAMMENRIESIIVNNLDSIIKHTTPAVDGGAIDYLSVAGQKRNTDQKSSNREKVTNARLYM